MSITFCRAVAEAILAGAAREHEMRGLAEMLLSGGVLDAAQAAMGEDYAAAPLLVDTREQDAFGPFLWRNGKREPLCADLATLAEGDYTTPSASAFVRIERKSLSDLYGSLFGSGLDASGAASSHQNRFRRELLRLGAYARRFIVVEGTPRDFAEHIIRRRRRIEPAAALQAIESMALDYDVPLRWCNGREGAEWFVGYALSRIHAQATDLGEARKAAKRGLALPWACAGDESGMHPGGTRDG